MKILAFCGGASNVDGKHPAPPPRGYHEYFGPPPHFTFHTAVPIEDLERDGISQDIEQIGDTPEDTVRNVLPMDLIYAASKNWEDLDWLNEILETEGPFQAVLGFSHGASVAATLLENETRRAQAQGLPSMFKLGIFFGGVPPYNVVDGGMFLADVDGIKFNLPTLHIIGSADPMVDLSLALYNLCDSNKARIFDHGRGHQLVWKKTVVQDLCKVLREMIHAVM
ncbi:MAG: hypothetical protein Q9178_006054 [Gyalolechia marmorata]